MCSNNEGEFFLSGEKNIGTTLFILKIGLLNVLVQCGTSHCSQKQVQK